MDTLPQVAQQKEIAQAIHQIDVKLQEAKNEQEHAALEHELAKALEKLLRQVTTKNA